MALISTLRTKMTKWVVGLVAVAMAAFILGSDFLGNGAQSFLGLDNSVGEIAGNAITMEEYQAAIQETENNYAMSLNRRPTDAEMPTIRQQAWDLLIARNAINPEFEKVGIIVTGDEEWDMVQGKNVDEGIRNAFRDSLGRFDRNRLMQQLQVFKNFPAGSPQRAQWDIYRANLAPARARLKYEALLLKSNYITQAEAERNYHEANDVAEVRYLYVPFFAVNDSAVTVSDADITAYYNKNKEKYRSQVTRSLSYVVFPEVATAADSATIRKGLEDLAQAFRVAENDSLFAVTNNSNPDGGGWNEYNASNLPAGLQATLNTLKPGEVVGPFLEADTYKVVKLVRTGSDTATFSRASHILFRAADASDKAKEDAKTQARKVLAEIKAGADFAAKAREFGSDGTATSGGDLGWFGKGAMVKPFENAVFGATREGLLNDVVETDFGYHIIKVTGLRNNTKYIVASVEEPIAPSEETRNEIYAKADEFANNLSGADAFREKAQKSNFQVSDANNLGPSERRMGNLGDARSIISWAYREGSVGKVSEAQHIGDQWVVAVVTAETEEGYRSLDKELKETITPLAKKQLIGKVIADKIKSGKGELNEIAKLFGTDAIVQTSSDLRLNSNSLVSVGFDPVAVGKAFAAEAGKRSAPIIVENGVMVVEGIRKSVAPDVTDLSSYKNQLLQLVNNRSSFTIGEALKNAAKIEDKRYRLF